MPLSHLLFEVVHRTGSVLLLIRKGKLKEGKYSFENDIALKKLPIYALP